MPYLLLIMLLLILIWFLFRLSVRWQRLEAQLAQPARIEPLFSRMADFLWLRDRLQLDQGMNYTRHWSAAPDFLKQIAEHSLKHQPSLILECGSGLSTLVLAACCRANGKGRVVSLEHEPDCAERTREGLKRHGLDAYAMVILAPLKEIEIEGEHYRWYCLGELPQGPYDLLVIDGPPGPIQPLARYPALPLLSQHLSRPGWVFLDDAERPDEKACVARWLSQNSAIKHHSLNLERGCSQLKLG